MSLMPQLTRRLRIILRIYWLSSTTSTQSVWIRSARSFFDSLDDMTHRDGRKKRRSGRQAHQTMGALRVGKGGGGKFGQRVLRESTAAADVVSIPLMQRGGGA